MKYKTNNPIYMLLAKRTRKSRRGLYHKMIALFLLHLFVLEIFRPTLYAVGGPNQPEMASFTPASASELVNLFTGDFSYNIPLLEVDGYPLNLAYNAGITPDQEASWVGLGWTLNPGAITRDVRGIPDDFKGDQIITVKNVKNNTTVGVSGGLSGEALGIEGLGGLSVGAGLSYNNYRGFDLTTNAGLTLGAGENSKGPFSAALSINNSSMNGITISPSLSLQTRADENEKLGGSLTVSSAFNSRSGVQQVSFGAEADFKQSKPGQKQGSVSKAHQSVSKFATANLGYSLPRVASDFENFSFTGRFRFGAEIFFSNLSGYVNGFYSTQKLRESVKVKNAYGCLNSSFADDPNTDLMDYARENENGFSFELPALPLAKMNPDVLSVAGQGISGSYKPFSNSFGTIKESTGLNTSTGLSAGFELAATNVLQVGGNVQRNRVQGNSGPWIEGNNGINSIGFTPPSENSFYENVYYQEANEKGQFVNEGFYYTTGGDKAVRFDLVKTAAYEHITTPVLRTTQGQTFSAANNYSNVRSKRNKPVALLTTGEVIGGGGMTLVNEEEYYSQHAVNNPHHIGEITVTAEDGKRHVYGLPVYNAFKKEVSFAVGTTALGVPFSGSKDCLAGTIQYNHGSDNSTGNNWGLDNFYSSETTPAYAHSYLPTCIMGVNYIDADDVQGPSENDFGEWVSFKYKRVEQNFKWRIPFDANTANYSAQIESDKTDDKANYVYGEKELIYVDQIDTRNYVVKFFTSDRKDGYGVVGEQGGISTTGAVMQKLDSIKMYTRMAYAIDGLDAVPVKSVHFVYEGEGFGYDLCRGVKSNPDVNGGKLTLHKVYFKYRNSNRGKYSPYEFNYGEDNAVNNPEYQAGTTGRWGFYRTADPLGSDCNLTGYAELPPSIFPYSDQDETNANNYAQAWNLKAINLPSGGRIEVDYESDRYEYVQHKKAMIMKTIDAVELNGTPDFTASASIINPGSYSNSNLRYGITLEQGTSIEDYVEPGQLVYFRSLVRIGTAGESERSDFISGYGKVIATTNDFNNGIGYIEFEETNIDGLGGQNPIVVAALQYARLHLSHMVYGTTLINTDGGLTLQLLEAIINSIANLGNMFTSPNVQILDNDRCKFMYIGKSWLKVHNPKDVKFAGGHRVKEVRMFDQWNDITGSADEKTIAQVIRYTYETENGRTSGVASNEPTLGGEESALLKPLCLSQENLLAPDNKFYVEEPFAKGFFPIPSVGYSRIVVEDLHLQDGVYRSAGTGYSVSEYFTAKDYPTFYSQTDIKQFHDKTPAVSFAKLFGHNVKDFISFSQGFVVETNDMHGKEKKVSIYAEGQTSPIQYTIYKYKDESYPWQGNSSTRRLINHDNTLIKPNGTISNNRPIGVFYELVADSKCETSKTEISTLQANVDASMVFVVPAAIGSAIPRKSTEETAFKYASLTKTIEKFGILESVTSYNEGMLSTENYLAFDSETGIPLVIETQNNFNDAYYTMKFPAYWGYEGMGPANYNQGFYAENITISSVGAISGIASSALRDGDEIILKQGSTVKRAWVSKIPGGGTRIIDRIGIHPSGSYQYAKINRSGQRNLLGQTMMDLITLENPLAGISDDNYSRVVSATGVEYGNIWRTICNCFGPESSALGMEVTNPYRLGARGMWRPIRSFTHLTARSQTDFNENSNIRRDGILSSFSPLYRQNGGWLLDPANWTFEVEVTDFSPEGYELETMDPLGRHSSSLYGYNRSLQTANAVNAEQREIGYDGFEDAEDAWCGTDHMRFVSPGNYSGVAHTGRKSIRVAAGNPVSISRDLQSCEPISNYSCEIVVEQQIDPTSGYLILSIGCFTDPLEINYEVLEGNAIVEINNNQITIYNPSGDFSDSIISIEIIDGADCLYSNTILFDPPQP